MTYGILNNYTYIVKGSINNNGLSASPLTLKLLYKLFDDENPNISYKEYYDNGSNLI